MIFECNCVTFQMKSAFQDFSMEVREFICFFHELRDQFPPGGLGLLGVQLPQLRVAGLVPQLRQGEAALGQQRGLRGRRRRRRVPRHPAGGAPGRRQPLARFRLTCSDFETGDAFVALNTSVCDACFQDLLRPRRDARIAGTYVRSGSLEASTAWELLRSPALSRWARRSKGAAVCP